MDSPIRPAASDGLQPDRLWNLWDVINFQLFGLLGWMMVFEQEKRVAQEKNDWAVRVLGDSSYEAAQVPRERFLVTGRDRKRLDGMLKVLETFCDQLNLIRTKDRITHFKRSLVLQPENATALCHQIAAMEEALHDDVPLKYFYFYPEDKVQRFLRVNVDWKAAFESFPSAEFEAESAVDCYALGHNDASVFHCMCVLEIGLRVLAKEVGLTFDTQQWYNIINDIEAKIGEIRQHGIPGLDKATKDDRLQFLSAAAKEFFYFKDGWRNYASHGKTRYDEHPALSVVEHVRAFMNHLASRLSEQP